MKYLSYRTSRLLFAYRMAKQVQIIWLLMIRRFSTASRNNCHCVGVTRLKHWYCWEIWKNSRLEFIVSVLFSFKISSKLFLPIYYRPSLRFAKTQIDITTLSTIIESGSGQFFSTRFPFKNSNFIHLLFRFF